MKTVSISREAYFAFCQNTKMRTPGTAQPKESPRNHKTGIPTTSPVTPQTTPKNTAARPENGTITPYFIGRRAKMTKNTPTATYVADTTRIAYNNSGESGNA